jgi:hypothetical protein
MALSKSLKKRNSVKRKYKTKTRKYLKKKQMGGSGDNAFIVIKKDGVDQILAARDYQTNALKEYINSNSDGLKQYEPSPGVKFFISKRVLRFVEDEQGNPMVVPNIYLFTRADGTSTVMSMSEVALRNYLRDFQ